MSGVGGGGSSSRYSSYCGNSISYCAGVKVLLVVVVVVVVVVVREMVSYKSEVEILVSSACGGTCNAIMTIG
jgi:hypothetical protein